MYGFAPGFNLCVTESPFKSLSLPWNKSSHVYSKSNNLPPCCLVRWVYFLLLISAICCCCLLLFADKFRLLPYMVVSFDTVSPSLCILLLSSIRHWLTWFFPFALPHSFPSFMTGAGFVISNDCCCRCLCCMSFYKTYDFLSQSAVAVITDFWYSWCTHGMCM